MDMTQKRASLGAPDVLIVGGGLGGLTAAALLARSGRRVVVLERSRTPGGRGASHEHEGHLFNLGGHALYRKGHALKTLRRLGVAIRGRTPRQDGNHMMWQGQLDWLPGGPRSFWSNRTFSWHQKWKVAQLSLSILTANTKQCQGQDLRSWIDQKVGGDELLRGMIEALFRVTNYANGPALQSAGAALAQAQRALSGNVLYLDGGWQTLVDGLVTCITQAGGVIQTESLIQEVLLEDSRVLGVVDASGQEYHAPSVILATPPAVATRMLRGEAAAQTKGWQEAIQPIYASCLDIALEQLPNPSIRFVLGLDQPLYFSVHTTYASLGRTDGEVIHLMKYAPANASIDAKATEAELETFLEQIQPGWREQLRYRRFLPQMVVSHALVTPALASAPVPMGPAVPGVSGLYLVGDWIGQGAMLADATVASAVQAAGLIQQQASASVALVRQ